MDHEENLQEQLEIATDVMKIWDSCDDNGEFTDSQTIEALTRHIVQFRTNKVYNVLQGYQL